MVESFLLLSEAFGIFFDRDKFNLMKKRNIFLLLNIELKFQLKWKVIGNREMKSDLKREK